MSLAIRVVSSTFALAAAATLVTAATAHAHVKNDQPITVQMPAAALADPAAKLCLPRALIEKSPNSNLPDPMCQTRDEWAAKGINIVAKK